MRTVIRFGVVTLISAALGVTAENVKAPSTTGWYNGDPTGPRTPVLPNWFFTDRQFSRVWDDFVVPAEGWTVVGVFSNSGFAIKAESDVITKAVWEIRRDMSPGKGGKKVASGISPARQIPLPGVAQYRIQVDGLKVSLKPGRYWLSVAPVGRGTYYVLSTSGTNAVGDPAGNNGGALFTHTEFNIRFADAGNLPPGRQFGKAQDYSQGVLINAK